MARQPENLTMQNFTNPTGSAGHTGIILRDLIARYNQFVSKDITLKVIHTDGKNFIFYAKVPSEKNFKYKMKIYYDVIVEYYPIASIKETLELDKKFVNYGIRCYSNCPTFTFVFTNVYNKMNALYHKIDGNLYSQQALEDPADTTNAKRLVGIEKSVWYTLRKIYDLTHYNKHTVIEKATKLPKDSKFPGNLFDEVMSQEDKLEEIKNAETIKRMKGSTHSRSLVANGKVLAHEEVHKDKKSNFESTLLGKFTSSSLGSILNSSSNLTKAIKENKLFKSFKKSEK